MRSCGRFLVRPLLLASGISCGPFNSPVVSHYFSCDPHGPLVSLVVQLRLLRCVQVSGGLLRFSGRPFLTLNSIITISPNEKREKNSGTTRNLLIATFLVITSQNSKTCIKYESITRKRELLPADCKQSVSYTHLTLPTNREV